MAYDFDSVAEEEGGKDGSLGYNGRNGHATTASDGRSGEPVKG